MADTNKDLFGVFKDIRQTGTQELSDNVSKMLASTPPKNAAQTGTASTGSMPKSSGNQISIAQERREKDVIDRRKIN